MFEAEVLDHFMDGEGVRRGWTIRHGDLAPSVAMTVDVTDGSRAATSSGGE
jgi:hypothetical protein